MFAYIYERAKILPRDKQLRMLNMDFEFGKFLPTLYESGMLGLEAWPRPRGLWPRPRPPGFGLGLVGFGLEPRSLSRPTAETERNVIGSESITNSQKSLMTLQISS